jgi:triphosphoribosyl-dephospho-CoA synthase
MSTSLKASDIQAAFLKACDSELQALKPGNVHIFEAGHGMEVKHFEDAAKAAAPFIADTNLKVGARILKATEASFDTTGLNTNLGIILLCAPLAKAAAETGIAIGLRRRLALILAELDIDDAVNAFAAIRIANPGGLGKADQSDVHAAPTVTLIEAMNLAAPRDRIANAYVTAYSDIFDIALPALADARTTAETAELAVTTLHMTLMAEFPDTHIARKYGDAAAIAVQHQARDLRSSWFPAPNSSGQAELTKFDRDLKARGLNPGTTADFVVATLFAEALGKAKQP